MIEGGTYHGQNRWQVPMLSRENDLDIFKKQKGKYGWSSDHQRREPGVRWGWEGKKGPKCPRFLSVVTTIFTLGAKKNHQGR